MKIKKIQDLTEDYFLANLMGSSKILREFINADDSFPIPLSLSHGIDFNHTNIAYDVESIEPIHWAYNEDIYLRSINTKPAIKIPHPWLMLEELISNECTEKLNRHLLIAPPPSKKNDKKLIELLSNLDIKELDILVKERGLSKKVNDSINFWESNGFNTVSAGTPDNEFYKRLYKIISKYKGLIACNMSSAVIFGISIGLECKLIKNFVLEGYETSGYLKKTNFNNNSAKPIINSIENNNYQRSKYLCRKILGSDFICRKHEIKNEIMQHISELKYPFHFTHLSRLSIFIRLMLYKFFKRQSILKEGVFNQIFKSFDQSVIFIKMDEFDVFENGLNEDNFSYSKADYMSGINDPGSG